MLEHIALIPDGNRRWAALHGVSSIHGHRAGAERMHSVVEHLITLGLRYLSVWGFSTDNWRRSDEEVGTLFHLLGAWIKKDAPLLHSRGVRLRHIGRLQELPRGLQQTITQAIELTKANTGMTLNLAFNYNGRADIVDAVRRLIKEGMPWHRVDEFLFSHYLYTDGAPDVDLVIRTAGEFRLSNFLLWQTAYSEFYFTPALWPDFDTEELEKALNAYSERKRRFGGD